MGDHSLFAHEDISIRKTELHSQYPKNRVWNGSDDPIYWIGHILQSCEAFLRYCRCTIIAEHAYCLQYEDYHIYMKCSEV